MEWIRQLQEAINFMEEHLLEDIRSEDAASRVHMASPLAMQLVLDL